MRRLRPLLLVAVVLLALLPAAPAAQAQATFTVSANRMTGVAATDDPPPDGVCDADCSLREAVQAANATPAADTIRFATAGTIQLGRAGTEAENSSFNDLDVTAPLTVDGDGAVTIGVGTLEGDHARVFDVDDVALTLTDLTLLGPEDTAQTTPFQAGLVIAEDATLTLDGVLLQDGAAFFAGAVLADRSTVTITRTTFADNGAFVIGALSVGGGSLTMSDSVVRGGGSLAGGVGMANQDGDGDLPGTMAVSIANTSFTDVAGGGLYVGLAADAQLRSLAFTGSTDGPALYVQSTADAVNVINSTFADNEGDDDLASAIHVAAAFPDTPKEPAPPGGVAVTVAFSTIAGNSGGTAAVVIDDDSPGAGMAFSSTILADNSGPSCGTGTFFSVGNNLEDADTCGFAFTGDQVDTDPDLGPTANNGGVPQGADGQTIGLTRALTADSPAVDNGDSSPGVCPDPVNIDQRGFPRPQFDGCDVGAFELGGGTLAIDKSVAPGTVQPGATATFTIVVTNTSDAPVAAAGMLDTIPAGLSIQQVTPASACPAPTTQVVSCDLGTLAPAQSVTIGVTVTADQPGTHLNTAAATIGGAQVATDDAPLVVATGCGGTGTSGSGIAEGVVRIQGLNRIQTSIAASQAACGDGEAPAIVLTRSDLFPDAQAGTPLALALGAPLLLSAPDALSPEAETEIQRVLAPGGTVYMLGGTAALSEAVDARIRALGFQTVRYGGQNRFGTAAIIADLGLSQPRNVLFADGGDFADSIVAGAAAAVMGEGPGIDAAVLLTSGADIPPETQAYLDDLGVTPTMVAVGASAGAAFPQVEQVGTADRFETSVAVAERFFDAPPIVGIARSDEFPDGLSGGSLVGRTIYGPGPILFTATDTLPAQVQAYLSANADSVTRALIFGGTAAVSSEVEAQVSAALG